jgi:hypothetical protein
VLKLALADLCHSLTAGDMLGSQPGSGPTCTDMLQLDFLTGECCQRKAGADYLPAALTLRSVNSH